MQKDLNLINNFLNIITKILIDKEIPLIKKRKKFNYSKSLNSLAK